METATGYRYAHGFTLYRPQEILLSTNQINILRTLKHELTHVWLWEYGHNQKEEHTYSFENVCEIVASSNNFINDIVAKYEKVLEGRRRKKK